MGKRDIKEFTLPELKEILLGMGEPGYRAEQIFHWIYQRGVATFRQMENIPLPLRKSLEQAFFISQPHLEEKVSSPDGTEKFLFRLENGNFIETVMIPAPGRLTVCLSTQVGCKYRCGFCASGEIGFIRNLSLAEIVNQLLFVRFFRKRKITNVVFMGMGEPFDNYEHLVRAIKVINCPKGLGIGARKITVSTCGIVSGIRRFADLGLQVELSLSLHAPDDQLRAKLMPVAKKYPLKEVLQACADYTKKTGRVITLEYLLVKGINDKVAHSHSLAAIARTVKAKVNLIGYNPVPGKPYQAPTEKEIRSFAARLASQGVNVTVRRSKGKDIQAACGQLAGKSSKVRE